MDKNQLGDILNFYRGLGVEYLNIKLNKKQSPKNTAKCLEKLKKEVKM
jgi:hypothetical protein